mgnify:CR=1 FL=1
MTTSPLLHPFASPSRRDFITIVRGDGAAVYDSEGRRYVDGLAPYLRGGNPVRFDEWRRDWLRRQYHELQVGMQEIREHVIDKGLSSIGENEVDWVFYHRGVTMSMMLAEAIRAAQEEFDETVVTPAQVRWGLENLNITEERLEELGMSGMIVPFQTTCANHTGHGGGWIIEWNGERFERVSDLLQADRERITPLEEAEAAKYAAANAPWPMNEECQL